MTPGEILKKHFGYDSFRTGQEKIIDSLISGRDCLAVMPTGAGKSICYQIPALVLGGITLIISPLISLMQDQVKMLNESGIRAAYINSSLSERQIDKALSFALNGLYKIIYVAPERLESNSFRYFAQNADISMVTVDEAHCISQWGQDFRPSYLKITEFIDSLAKRPVIGAFTATATDVVKNDIVRALELKNPCRLVTGFDRPNLFFSVERNINKDKFVLKYIKEHPNESGIIYCATRKRTDSVFELLIENGISAARYHAGMSSEERTSSQNDFIYDKCSVIAATNAFGMGIDKSNVRFVIHYNMPQSIENYYQEAGRAGRDGETAQCILLFSPQDVEIARFLIEHKELSEDSGDNAYELQERDYRRLRIMEKYCRGTGCLRKYLLNYFGEHAEGECNNCSNCLKEFTEADMTTEAKWVLNCVYEANGRFGISLITDTLVGSRNERVNERGLFRYKSYGMLKGTDKLKIRSLIDHLIQNAFLVQTTGKYSVVQLGPRANELRDPNMRVIVKLGDEKKEETARKSKIANNELTDTGKELFEILRILRKEIADEEDVPPYVVFGDKTLKDMCIKMPSSKNDMLEVSGVGEVKLQKYGERFMYEIINFADEHKSEPTSIYTDSEIMKSGKTKRQKEEQKEFALSQEEASKFPYEEYAYISSVLKSMNELRTDESMKKVNYAAINDFLEAEDIIYFVREEEKNLKVPTEKGYGMGLKYEDRVSAKGVPYQVLLFSKEVQEMIVNHFTSNTYVEYGG